MTMNNTFHYLDEIYDFLGQQVLWKKILEKDPGTNGKCCLRRLWDKRKGSTGTWYDLSK